MRWRDQFSGTKAKQLRRKGASGVANEIGGEKLKHRAYRRTENETFALVPSFLQGDTSIGTQHEFRINISPD
jgi:hypothetical protein